MLSCLNCLVNCSLIVNCRLTFIFHVYLVEYVNSRCLTVSVHKTLIISRYGRSIDLWASTRDNREVDEIEWIWLSFSCPTEFWLRYSGMRHVRMFSWKKSHSIIQNAVGLTFDESLKPTQTKISLILWEQYSGRKFWKRFSKFVRLLLRYR